tara:strand:- start:3199 stop:3801 length:603 start_codon:yes stop_codon:yes gene_type:complete
MFNKKPKIICITGSDGSGKSTLIANLLNELPNAKEVTIWDAFNNKKVSIFSNKKEIDMYLCLLSSDARVLFLSHALKYAIDKAIDSKAEIILLNAYYYKYFSSEISYGASRLLIKSLVEIYPVPDINIFLSLSPEISVLRKKQLSKYECGCKEATRENFINFQQKVNESFKIYIQPDWFELDAQNSPEELKNKTLKILSL